MANKNNLDKLEEKKKRLEERVEKVKEEAKEEIMKPLEDLSYTLKKLDKAFSGCYGKNLPRGISRNEGYVFRMNAGGYPIDISIYYVTVFPRQADITIWGKGGKENKQKIFEGTIHKLMRTDASFEVKKYNPDLFKNREKFHSDLDSLYKKANNKLKKRENKKETEHLEWKIKKMEDDFGPLS